MSALTPKLPDVAAEDPPAQNAPPRRAAAEPAGTSPHRAPAASARARTLPSHRGGAGAHRPRLRAAVLALLRKELLVELRTLESVPGMSLFALSTFVVFHFALNRASVDGDLAAGILFVTVLLASLLGINRLFVADAEQGGFDGFLLAPVDGTAMLLAKVLALLAYLVALEVVAVASFALLLLGPSLAPALPGLAIVLALADLGIAVVGTLIAALVVRSRARDLLGPLLALPLLIPVVIGATSALAPLLSAHAPAFAAWLSGSATRWLATLALYDLLFGLLAYAVFDFLLED
jgi:heme exporter protein B